MHVACHLLSKDKLALSPNKLDTAWLYAGPSSGPYFQSPSPAQLSTLSQHIDADADVDGSLLLCVLTLHRLRRFVRHCVSDDAGRVRTSIKEAPFWSEFLPYLTIIKHEMLLEKEDESSRWTLVGSSKISALASCS